MKRDRRSSRLSRRDRTANFYSSIAGGQGHASGNPRYRHRYHAPFVIKCGVNVIKRLKYSRARL